MVGRRKQVRQEMRAAGLVPPPSSSGLTFDEIERLASEDPFDRLDRQAHGFTYEDDWHDKTLVCRNGCGLTYYEVVCGKVRICNAEIEYPDNIILSIN